MPTPLHYISPQLSINKVQLFVKREDLNHPLIQGNKLHKLRPNFEAAQAQGNTAVLTFGGAFSNHLYATAAAGKAYNMPTIGIVRGMAADFDNPTLSACRAFGMQLFKVEKKPFDTWAYGESPLDAMDNVQTIVQGFPHAYFLPMGGSNILGLRGCMDFGEKLLQQSGHHLDGSSKTHICLAAGTGGTTAGVFLACGKNAKILAFPPMKGGLDKAEILRVASLLDADFSKKNADSLQVIPDYSFGGYGRLPKDLIAFCLGFEEKTGIQADPIYTSKLFYGVLDLIERDFFPENSQVVVVHSGGMQGWAGFEKLLKNKGS